MCPIFIIRRSAHESLGAVLVTHFSTFVFPLQFFFFFLPQLGSTPPNGFLGGSSHGHSHGPMAYVAAMNGSGHGLNAFQRVNSAGAGAGPGAHPGFHQVRVSPSHSRVEDSIDELLDGEEIEDDGEGDLYSDDGEGERRV